MSANKRIDEFEEWLRRRRSDELALFNRSIVEGIVALAGKGTVTDAHVAQAVALANESTLFDPARIERLGKLYVEFIAEPPAPEARPSPAARAGASIAKPARSDRIVIEERVRERPSKREFQPTPVTPLDAGPSTIVAPSAAIEPSDAKDQLRLDDTRPIEAPVPVEPGPGEPPLAFSISIKKSAPLLTIESKSLERAPEAASASDKRVEKPGTSPHVLLGMAILVAIVVGVVMWTRGGVEGDGAAIAPPAATTLPVSLRAAVGVAGALPAGWHEALDRRRGTVSADTRSTVVYRGQSVADPEHGAFVATIVLPAPSLSDDTLIALARDAEAGAIAKLPSADYQSLGCATTARRIAACRGRVGDAVTMQTYVRAGDTRAMVVVFTGRLPPDEARREADAIVNTLVP